MGTLKCNPWRQKESIRISWMWPIWWIRSILEGSCHYVTNVKNTTWSAVLLLRDIKNRNTVSRGHLWHLEPEAWHTSWRRHRLYLVTWLNLAKYRQLIHWLWETTLPNSTAWKRFMQLDHTMLDIYELDKTKLYQLDWPRIGVEISTLNNGIYFLQTLSSLIKGERRKD